MKIICPHCAQTFEYEAKDTDQYFQDWWLVYPRRDAKGQARKAYGRALLKATPEILLSRAILYANACKGREKEFIRLPATWLNGESWNDESLIGNDPAELLKPAPPIPASWNGHWQALGKLIGETKCQTWFATSQLVLRAGEPAVIYAGKPFQRDWIISHFAVALHRLLGEFEVRVSPLPSAKPPPD